MNKYILANFITDQFDCCITYGEFIDELKHADIIPVHRKNVKCDKTNYRPMSILTNISKIYEKIMYNQFSKHLARISKRFQFTVSLKSARE